MPKLLLFAVCEKVIIDDRGAASIITLVHAMEAAAAQQGPITGPIPKNAVAPRPWAIFSIWSPTAGDVGKEFSQKIRILYPDGTEFVVNEAPFKFELNRIHQNTVNVLGFPVGQTGDVTINLWVESDGKPLGEVHSWSVTVAHKKASN